MSACFITSTGTDLGKTFVTAGLVRTLRMQGRGVTALKPVVSGFDPENPTGSDPAVLIEAAGGHATLPAIDVISPFRFHAPLSPDMAARAEGRVLDFEKVIAFCRSAETKSEPSEVLLIEGVGGIMVPLDERHTVLDWMVALGHPLVLVAGSYLGAISHILSALDVLERRGLTLLALVISETLPSSVPLEDTLSTLRSFAKIPIITLRRQVPQTVTDADFIHLASLITGS
ncbi:dethiobiotin synthase [Beijerinckia indica]|uniref:ATP-dependent dethiobiotin synthetase BioD n=1 Tax=Beijerinckia indica subsp. indica (strain ATCC 9039 / DSM 1715 / NCIMB 8712) TaxID=395963 RepID=B2IH49_BEII9|nr:dethiobiotin synthase [Beijerinckia indica]ACB94463.1 dethiobiotin synthase [Beijerinckia indica subsp. indica ATCC 9039]